MSPSSKKNRSRETVKAAGALVWRENGKHLEVLLVHRPRYDDWSIPKGKVESCESVRTCAVREVAEETGIRGRIIRHLASIDYWFSGNDRRVHKVVHHYLMGYESGTISVDGDPDHEAEEAAWVPLRDVSRQLAYPNERRIVRIALDLLYRDGRD